MLRLATTLLAAAALTLLPLTCANFEDAEESSTPTLHFAVAADCTTLDPQNTSAMIDFRIIDLLFEGLVSIDAEDLSVRPGLAALPDISADGLTYTFRLDPDARWSNGDPVTSHDVRFAWRRALTFDFGAVYSGLFFVIDGAEDFYRWREQQLDGFTASGLTAAQAWADAMRRFDDTVGIHAPDDRTLTVRLRSPTAYFTALCAFGTLRPNHAATVGDAITLDADTGRASIDAAVFNDPARLLSNGPYRLDRWTPRRRLVLVVDPHHRVPPATPRIVQSVVEDNPGLAVVRYLDGRYDWLPDLGGGSLAIKLREAAARTGRDDLHALPRAGVEYYAFNARPTVDGAPNPLADPRVRRAMAMAVDRQSLVDQVNRLGEPVARSFVPAGAVAGYDPPVDADPGFDPAAARALLAAAGFPGGRGLPVLRLVFNTNAQHERRAVRLCNQWREELGIRVVPERYEWRVYLERRRAGDFHLARGGWYGDYPDPTTWLDLFQSANPQNNTGYASPAYDAHLAAAAETLDARERLHHLQNAERVLLNDSALIPLYQPVALQLYNPQRVRNLHQNPWNQLNLVAVEAGDASE